MHLGNVWAALLSWLSCKSRGGKWLLRIEDIDPQRSRAEYADLIRDDLNWLGLRWDGECTQSERYALYEAALQRLTAQGCTCGVFRSRQERLAVSAPQATGTAVPTDMPAARKPATGLLLPDETIAFCDGHYGEQRFPLREGGDMILRRADGAWAYQLAVVVDDALTGVTEVVRGRDLLPSVPRQLYLYKLLGYAPPAFLHIPLLCNEAGQRLSKRDKALDMGELRQHHTAPEIIGHLAFLSGLQAEEQPATAEQLLPIFDWGLVPKEDITPFGSPTGGRRPTDMIQGM